MAPNRTLVFYPDYWDKPVPNTSPGWDWKGLKHNQATKEEGENSLLPLATIDLPAEKEFRAVPEVGDLVAFSGAHLHGSTKNTSNETRFSFETRTVDIKVENQGQGAPNVDGESLRPGWPWFRRLRDGERL